MVFQGLIDCLRFAWYWGHMYSRHRRIKTKLTVYFKLWKPGRAWKKGLNVDKIILCWWIKRKSGGFLFSYTARYLHQRIAEHENSAIGKHFSIAHGDASLLRESQFGILKKMSGKIWLSCHEKLFIKERNPEWFHSRKTRSLFERTFHHLLSYLVFLKHFYNPFFDLIMMLAKRRNVVKNF